MNLKQKESSEIERNPLPIFQKGVPLPLVLVVPFVLQIFAAVSITGYLSFRNGQKAVSDLATDLEEVSDRASFNLTVLEYESIEQALPESGRHWQFSLTVFT